MKQTYINLLKKTKRKGINGLIDWLERSDFFVAPASTQYHGNYTGGLLEHSLNVYNALVFELENLKDSDFNLSEISEDSVILVSLLHDICKVNCYVESTRNVKNEQTGKWEQVPYYKRDPLFPMGHGGKSIFIAQQFIQLSPEEAQAIYWHMSAFDAGHDTYNTYNELTQAYSMNLLAFLLHQADMKATYILENPLYKME